MTRWDTLYSCTDLPCDKVSELVDGELEVVDDLVERRGERLVILVREDVVDPGVLEEVLLVDEKRTQV